MKGDNRRPISSYRYELGARDDLRCFFRNSWSWSPTSRVGVFLPANQSETSCGDKPSILASSERRPNFLSAQSLSSVINLVDSFDAILLYAISGEFYLW